MILLNTMTIMQCAVAVVKRFALLASPMIAGITKNMSPSRKDLKKYWGNPVYCVEANVLSDVAIVWHPYKSIPNANSAYINTYGEKLKREYGFAPIVKNTPNSAIYVKINAQIKNSFLPVKTTIGI